ARVAAVLGLRRLLQHHDPLGAALARRDRRLEGRAAAADDNDVAPLHAPHGLLLRNLVGWAKARNAPCPRVAEPRGHASLCLPYASEPCEGNAGGWLVLERQSGVAWPDDR